MTGTSVAWRRRLLAIVLTFAASAIATFVYAVELPPEIQADRLLLQAERDIGQESFVKAFATLDRILALQAEHGLEVPAAFWFKYAHVAHEAGLQTQAGTSANRYSTAAELHTKAVESATQYLATAGRGGSHYLEALELLDVAERAAEAVVARAKATAAAQESFEAALRDEALEAAVREAIEAVIGGEPLELVTIPAGTYRMGCVSDIDCQENEKPVHWVHIEQPFAKSKHEVTFAQWDACVLGGGCGGHRPDDEGRGRGNRPVINVSWDDAQFYVKWLSGQTGHGYRLPTEAEWEYAARAGTATAYSWGNDVGRNLANCLHCGSQWDDESSAPVGSFPSNAFGLHDMHGNVMELTQDCWNKSYAGAPAGGSAWRSGNCSKRVLRNGSWFHSRRTLRSAYRDGISPGVRSHLIGFRVARTLTR